MIVQKNYETSDGRIAGRRVSIDHTPNGGLINVGPSTGCRYSDIDLLQVCLAIVIVSHSHGVPQDFQSSTSARISLKSPYRLAMSTEFRRISPKADHLVGGGASCRSFDCLHMNSQTAALPIKTSDRVACSEKVDNLSISSSICF